MTPNGKTKALQRLRELLPNFAPKVDTSIWFSPPPSNNPAVTMMAGFYSQRNTLDHASQAYTWGALRVDESCEMTEEDCVQGFPEGRNGRAAEWSTAIKEKIIEPADG